MMRPYTNEFSEETQQAFEGRIDEIIASGTNLPARDIISLLFIDWEIGLDTPVHIESFTHALHSYLYTPVDPFVIKDSVTGAGILLFCMKRSFPHLVRERPEDVAA